MRCPKCGFRDDKVIDSRQSRDSSSIRRRRVCLKCSFRFTTYEEIERSELRVIKRDRTHEPFDRRKLVSSLAKACEKRSISLVTLEQAVDEIVHEVQTAGREVTSAAIGTKVLEKLRAIDEVAYLRYESVHRRFDQVDQFVDAIQALGRRIKPNPSQRELFPPENVTHGSVYPSWWLTDHITESIAFYLRLRNDEPVVPFSQLSQTVRYVLKVIGYKEIIPYFAPNPPPIAFSLLEVAEAAGAGYELAFFDGLEKRINALIHTGTDSLQLVGLQACVKHLSGAKAWTRACDTLREEVICFVREKLAADGALQHIRCSIR